jgi:Tfp pilus assembly protein PilF
MERIATKYRRPIATFARDYSNMKSSHTLTDQAIEQMSRAAHEFLSNGRHDRYLELMDQAAKLNPANHRVPIDVGIYFLRRYDYPSAKVWFERAVAGTPIQVDVLESIAFYCRNLMRYDLAAQYLQRAAALGGATANTFAKLAEMSERFAADGYRSRVGRARSVDGTGKSNGASGRRAVRTVGVKP